MNSPGSHSCGSTCSSGTHMCSAGCVSNMSVASCGSSCGACPIPNHGSPTCDGSSCGMQCDAMYLACAGACAPCPTGGLSFACSGAQCVATSCAPGQRPC